MRTVLLLICSNLFMTVAWYGHLKFKGKPLFTVIAASWLIALPEYILQVPANRYGHGQFTAPQLKIIQEAISISIFILFSIVYLREAPNWRAGVAFVLILAAVALVVTGGGDNGTRGTAAPSANGAVTAKRGESSLEVRG